MDRKVIIKLATFHKAQYMSSQYLSLKRINLRCIILYNNLNQCLKCKVEKKDEMV